jgi:hypothetical protein
MRGLFNTSQPVISVPHADAHLVLDAQQLAAVVDDVLQVGDDGLADPCGAAILAPVWLHQHATP